MLWNEFMIMELAKKKRGREKRFNKNSSLNSVIYYPFNYAICHRCLTDKSRFMRALGNYQTDDRGRGERKATVWSERKS